MADKYLLIVDYTSEGYSIERFATKEDMIEAVKNGQTFGNSFILAKEIELSASN